MILTSKIQLICEFGKGDILVGGFVSKDFNSCVTFNRCKPLSIAKPIKRSEAEKESLDSFPALIFKFDNIKSIDVVIEHLQQAKKYLLDFENIEI